MRTWSQYLIKAALIRGEWQGKQYGSEITKEKQGWLKERADDYFHFPRLVFLYPHLTCRPIILMSRYLQVRLLYLGLNWGPSVSIWRCYTDGTLPTLTVDVKSYYLYLPFSSFLAIERTDFSFFSSLMVWPFWGLSLLALCIADELTPYAIFFNANFTNALKPQVRLMIQVAQIWELCWFCFLVLALFVGLLKSFSMVDGQSKRIQLKGIDKLLYSCSDIAFS